MRAKSKLGTEAMADNPSSGNARILPAGCRFGSSPTDAVIKKMTKQIIKRQMPTTPDRAINFNFSILETRVRGISKSAISSTKKYSWV